MKLDWAILADAASARENLGFILGAGIDTMFAGPLPEPHPPDAIAGPVAFAIVIRALLHRAELGRQHKIEIKVADQDGTARLGIVANFIAPQNPTLEQGWDQPALFSIPVQMWPTNFGLYSVDIFGDDVHLRSLPFRVKALPT